MKQPSLFVVLITMLFISVFTVLCSLGYWQLCRAAEKQSLLSKIEGAHQLDPLSSTKLLELLKQQSMPERFTPVRFNGIFIHDKTLLLDNKHHQGNIGYHVIEPFLLNNEHIILVNRGWIPSGPHRNMVPQPLPITGEVVIEGSLDFAYRNRFISNSLETDLIQWPLRMQQLDLGLLKSLLGKNIYPMLVILKKNSPYAFEVPQPSIPLSPGRHRGYALQWFSLAATLGFMAFIALLNRNKNGYPFAKKTS